MMEPGVKIAAASSVLLGGILLALLFRHDVPGAGPAVPATGDRLALREQFPPPQLRGPAPGRYHRPSESPLSASDAAGAAGRRATVLTPMEPGQPPPALARDYPGAAAPSVGHSDPTPNGRGRSGWGTSIELPPAIRRAPPPPTHKIVDGDTLRVLAGRYLGSADRYLEIYEANRDRLPSPELLPIGVELKIPPLPRRPPPSSGLTPQRPLVSIPRRVTGED